MHRPATAARPAGTLAIAILGADAMLAAQPATPVQLAHACMAMGYDVAVPASWGDELLAAECLRQLSVRGPRPAVMCACPHVRSELLSVGPDLAPVLVALVPPPVAVARYLHAIHGSARLHLTYVGACPGARDDIIDASVTPAEFLAGLAPAGISLTDQPHVFDSVIPPDRRRFFSAAGGVPSAEQLWGAGLGRSLVELDGEDYLIDLAQHLLSHECALIDLAPRLGCACSGVSASVPARSARAAVAVIEPPRAASAVVDLDVAVDVCAPIDSLAFAPDALSGGSGNPANVAAPHEVATPGSMMVPGKEPGTRASRAGARRAASAPGIRVLQRAVPTTRVAGRMMPRAYVARRRSAVTLHETPIERPVTRTPASVPADAMSEEVGRRRPARVATAPLSHDGRMAPVPVTARGAGTAEKMSDGPAT